MLTHQYSFLLLIIGLFIFSPRLITGDNCFFDIVITKNETQSGQFGDKLENVTSPCIIRFSTSSPGAVRLDFNNKIFTNNNGRKRSCLSEYVRVDSVDRSVLLCHSNVTTPVQIGDTENSGYFDLMTPVIVTMAWSGHLDTSTQYMGSYNFVGLTSVIGRADSEDDKRSENIITKLKTFYNQRDHPYDAVKLEKYKFMTRESCYEQDKIVCEHSQFCVDRVMVDNKCNTSLYLCVGKEVRCDGQEDCLHGDKSDEVGCYLPYVMFSTGSLVLSLTLVASLVCMYQHHHSMSAQGMTRYKQDLVRRKDKVKARNAENKKNKPESSSSSTDPKEMSSMTPLTQLPPSRPTPAPSVNKVNVPDKGPNTSSAITPLSASSIAASSNLPTSRKNETISTELQYSSATLPHSAPVTRGTMSVSHQEMQTEMMSPMSEMMMSTDPMVQRTRSSDHLLEGHDNGVSASGTRAMSTCLSEDSVATVATRDSVHSLKSVRSVNGDISKGGYGYRFDFRSSCEFEFTEDVYI